MRQLAVLFSLALCASMLSACRSAFREHHFFASKDPTTGEPVNYYRLEVYGSTDLSSSRYLSGYFDPDAVASYFGEISASADDQKFPTAAQNAASGATQTTKSATTPQPVQDANLTSVDPRKQGRQLVMLLSSNSEAIADELGELASSKDLAVSIAAFAASSRSNQSQEAALATSAERSDAGRIMAFGFRVPRWADAAPADLRRPRIRKETRRLKW